MSALIDRAKIYCISILEKSRCHKLPFHNEKHTLQVYENVVRIGAYEKLDFEELEPVLLAALFHDLGNVTTFLGHENLGIDKAKDFLCSEEYPKLKMDTVIKCIRATRMPQQPKSIYENIICDADLYHLGTNEFLEKNMLLRKEWSDYLSMDYSDEIWNTLNIQFLQQHKFHTNFGIEILEPIKKENIELLSNQKFF